MKRAILVLAMTAAMSGCGGASSPLLNMPPSSPPAQSLLYVIVAGFSDVYYYSYLPAPLKFVGKLTGLNSPRGLCVDKAGNVFVTGNGYVAKYAHGGTKPVATLKIPKMTAEGCAIDPATGNLAVVAYSQSTSGGLVLIFQNAQGTPKQYADGYLQFPNDVGYDDKSNLYVDGSYYYYQNPSCCFVPAFAEIPAQQKTFKPLNLNVAFSAPSTIQWDGTHLAIEDASVGVIYEFRISANKGTEVGKTALQGFPSSIYPVQATWISGNNVIGADSSYAEVGVWQYPKGGKPFRAITGLYEPIAVAVSP